MHGSLRGRILNVGTGKRNMDPVSDWLLEFADRMQLVDLRICDGGAA